MTKIKSLTCAAALVLVVCAAAEAQQKEQAKSSPAQIPTVEYSSATNPAPRTLSEFVRVGNMLYLSGKLGTDSTGKLAPGGIGPETKQTLENIKAVLEKNGSSMDNVVKCTVMMADIKEWADMNTVYVTFFKKERLPARSAFGTSGLVNSARVEIECMATVK
ncbi:MAG TPA: RidA family protein [Blastocatellia bacterium]|nr:RidA family protein [Blastocatellia bacterium]